MTVVPGRLSRLRPQSILRYVFLTVVSLITLSPLLWIITLSIKTKREYAGSAFALPAQLYWGNFQQVLNEGQLLKFSINSVITTVTAIVIVLVASSLAGYALARIRFRGNHFLMVLFLVSNSIPIFVILIPLFILINWLGLSQTRWSLIFPYTAMNMGISILIMRGFFRSVSADLEDAAQIDGCTLLQTIVYVMLPIVRPALVVTAIFNFISFWNEYYLATVLLPSQDMFTLPAGLAAIFKGQYVSNWPVLAAGIVVSILPTLGIFILAQDKIVQGWTTTVK